MKHQAYNLYERHRRVVQRRYVLSIAVIIFVTGFMTGILLGAFV